MTWENSNKTRVMLIADTNTGSGEEISTPYNETSIIWNDVKQFPTEEIREFVPPTEVTNVSSDVSDIQFVEK